MGKNIPFVTPKDIQGSKHILETERYLTDEGMLSVKGSILPPNTVCVSCIGNIGYVSMTTKKSVSNQQINSIIANDENDANFIYYLIKSLWPYFKNYEGQSTTISILNKSQFSKISVNIPPLDVQRKIAGVLGALDDKIELNNKINNNLEQQAQALFKSWFVDFEPFAGKMPKDWKIQSLKELCEVITKGTTPTTLKKAFVEKGINFIKAESILDNHSIDLNKIMFIDEETNTILKRSQIRPFDILYTIAGTIGRFAIVLSTQTPANTNQAVAIIRCKQAYTLFIYNMLICGCHLSHFKSKVVQAVQANLSLGSIGELPVLLPTLNIIEMYTGIIKPIFQTIFNNYEESRKLAQLRDALLPKLMSGEIDVSNVNIDDLASADKLSFTEK